MCNFCRQVPCKYDILTAARKPHVLYEFGPAWCTNHGQLYVLGCSTCDRIKQMKEGLVACTSRVEQGK